MRDFEIDLLLKIAGTDLTKKTARSLDAFKFAIETAMRAGEIINLKWDDVNSETRVAVLLSATLGFYWSHHRANIWSDLTVQIQED